MSRSKIDSLKNGLGTESEKPTVIDTVSDSCCKSLCCPSGGLYFNVFQHDSVWLLMVRIFIHYNYEVTLEAITVT